MRAKEEEQYWAKVRWRYWQRRKAQEEEAKRLERRLIWEREFELRERDDVPQKILGYQEPKNRIERIQYFQRLKEENEYWKRHYSSVASEEEWEFLKEQPDHFDSKSDWEKRRPQ